MWFLILFERFFRYVLDRYRIFSEFVDHNMQFCMVYHHEGVEIPSRFELLLKRYFDSSWFYAHVKTVRSLELLVFGVYMYTCVRVWYVVFFASIHICSSLMHRYLMITICHIYIYTVYTYIYILVGGLEHFLFSHILGIIIPIDQYFFRGVQTTNQYIYIYPTCLSQWCHDFITPSILNSISAGAPSFSVGSNF